MRVLPIPQTVYLPGDPDLAFATVHPAGPHATHDAGVLLCPPFGWDEVCAYRSLRLWAARLAADGYTSLRLSHPSTGDSGGWPRDPDRIGAWIASVGSAAAWLREVASVRRIVAIGIGLGGIVAYSSAGESGVDDLVLWGTPSQGRVLTRHLNAFGKLERARFYEGIEPGPEPAGGRDRGRLRVKRRYGYASERD
ncbi:MAG: hypothetical protein M3Y35_09365 [Actinomycetota bacterium]|nr:hypothetical protein [Actinomycetota bacterium]